MTIAGAGERRAVAVVTVADIAWVAVALIFVLMRLGPTWQSPVGGAELDAVSGAWNAQLGIDDARWTPTLFQAITSLTFEITSSAVPARVLAFLVTASIPGAIYLLRGVLGLPGALLALLLLAFDATSINLGSTANASALDLALVAWVFVLYVRRPRLPLWTGAAVGFALATAGAIVLPFVVAAFGLALYTRALPSRDQALAAAAGAIGGVALASAGFGRGIEGLVIPPIDVFAASFERSWSTASAIEVAALYSAPVIIAGLAALGWSAVSAHRTRDGSQLLLMAWAAVAALWLVAGGGSESTLPVAALALPLALILGPATVRAIEAMIQADWRYARYLLPIAALAAAVATNFCLTWADRDQVGGGGEQAVVVLLYGVAVLALAAICLERRAIPALYAAALAIGVIPVAAGAFGVALSAQEEPIPSPISPPQARELRRIALETVADRGGLIVIHPDFAEAMTWPFRESGEVHLTSQVPGEATIVIWPATAEAPEGMVALEGDWAFEERIVPPTGSWLDVLEWLADRNELQISATPVAVYTVASE